MNAPTVAASTFVVALAFAVTAPAIHAQCDVWASDAETATGVVFEDVDRNGRLDPAEPAVSGVSVSNGCDVARTDDAGFYEISVAPGQILFVSQPRGYVVPVDENNVPRFFYIHYPDGTPTQIDGTSVEWQWEVIEPTGPLPASIDFPLHRLGSVETRFTAHGFADPQARSDLGEDMLREELVNTLLGNPYGAEFALTVGDVVFDNLGLYDRHKAMIGLVGIPQWTLPGNHDLNYESPNAHFANETYKKHFGPTYYSFDYGNVHVVALNNVEYAGAPDRSYRGFISDDQIRWLEQDLAHVPRDRLVVIASHISLISEASDGSQAASGPRTENFDRLLELLRPFDNVYGLAGHDTSNSWKVEINHEHGWTGQPWIAHTLAEVRGSGWTRGPRDLRGVADAMMEDGNPNGFYLLRFDDVALVPEFIPFSFGSDGGQRLRIVLDPELESADGSINRGRLRAGTKVVVNLFDGGARDRVRMSLDGGPSVPMRYVVRTDPFVERAYGRLAGTAGAFPSPALSAHIWELELPAGLAPGIHSVVVETEDEFGQRNRGALSFEVTGTEAAWRETLPSFDRHEIPFEQGSYATAFDVDQDDRLDIVVLGRGGAAAPLVWYKNPTWERFTITSATSRNIYIAPNDIDGDGDTDIAIASEFALAESTSGGHISWVENPGDPTAHQDWTLRPIDVLPSSHRMRWGDIDGDGAKELLNLPIVGYGAAAPEYVGASRFTAYSIPSDKAGTWASTVLDDSRLEVAHGIRVVDWDGDASEDVLTASNHGVMLFRPALGGDPQQIGAGVDADRPNRGSSEVSIGSLGGERFIATIEPWHGTDAVIYRPGDSGSSPWSRQVIGTDLEGGHGLFAADLNGDGYDEVVGGGRGGDGSLLIYRYLPASMGWDRMPLDPESVAVQSAEGHDIDGDGDVDILVLDGVHNAVVWYENRLR